MCQIRVPVRFEFELEEFRWEPIVIIIQRVFVLVVSHWYDCPRMLGHISAMRVRRRRTEHFPVIVPVAAENYDSLGLVLLKEDFPEIPEKMRQSAILAHWHRQIYLHHRRRMGKEECRNLFRGRRELIEGSKPLFSRLGSGHSHWCGKIGDG